MNFDIDSIFEWNVHSIDWKESDSSLIMPAMFNSINSCGMCNKGPAISTIPEFRKIRTLKELSASYLHIKYHHGEIVDSTGNSQLQLTKLTLASKLVIDVCVTQHSTAYGFLF